jgi:ATP-dependent Clp protease ATP-binding subunit ClpA
MSELMEAHSVSKLIGSPPGYVGYGEGGQLTEQIRYNPYSVVLFDEIEKAHPDVMQLLLQLLDEGQLTDSRGVTVNFRNCIVLMTSNIGADRMQKNHVVGFGATDQDNMDGVKKMLRQHLRPEFINRLDEIVMFNSLTKEVCNNILNNELKKFIARMGTKQVKVQITKPVRKLLIDEGFDTKYGARPLRRVIQSRVQTPLAKHMLLNDGPLDLSIQLNNGVVVIEQKETPAG